MTEYNRRSADKRAIDIERMIEGENDPDKRVFLIVLNSINNSMVANTDAIHSLSNEFKSHLEAFKTHVVKEEGYWNQGKGIWRVLAGVLALAQVLVGYAWMQNSSGIDKINDAIVNGKLVDAQVLSRLELLEKRMK